MDEQEIIMHLHNIVYTYSYTLLCDFPCDQAMTVSDKIYQNVSPVTIWEDT